MNRGELNSAIGPPAENGHATLRGNFATKRRRSVSATRSPSSTNDKYLCMHDQNADEHSGWQCIEVLDGFLRLELTLFCGQAFRWVDTGTVDWGGQKYREYAGSVNDTAYVLRQPEAEQNTDASTRIYYRALSSCVSSISADEQLRDYFNADFDMRPLVAAFCERDSRFREVFPYLRGVRTLRQHPTECVFAFICSSNNNVKRITGMVCGLARSYGNYITTFKGNELYSFPSVEKLASSAVEEELRNAGFGYRAKFIVKAAAQLNELGGEKYLLSLRSLDRHEVSNALTSLFGIGRKVASCIALMSLDCPDEIPCDTHVWQIAVRNYMPSLKTKSLTDRVYTQIGDHFRDLHGPYAGWASNILFLAELSDFRHLVPTSLRGSATSRIQKISKVEESTRDTKVLVKSEETQSLQVRKDNSDLSATYRKTKRVRRTRKK